MLRGKNGRRGRIHTLLECEQSWRRVMYVGERCAASVPVCARGHFCTVRAQRVQSANYYVVYPGNTLKTTHLRKDV